MRLPRDRILLRNSVDWARHSLLCCLLALVMGSSAVSESTLYEWTEVSRIVAIGDVHGLSRADILVFFTESPENVANTAPDLNDGIWFI